MSTPNELAAALMVDHADVVTDAKRARDRVAHIGNMLAQYAATITVEQLTSDAQALLTAGEDIRRYERVAAHLLAAAEKLTADDHPDEPGPARTDQDDTGPDRTDTGRMVAESGYPTAPANGPEAGQ